MAPPARQPPVLLHGVAAAGPVTLLAAASGGGYTAAASGSTVSLLTTQDGGCTLLPPPPDRAGKPLACLAAAGAFVAAGERGSKPGLHVWRVGADSNAALDGTEIAHALHNFGIAALAFSPSGRMLASHGADKDWQMAVWNPASGRLLGKAREKGQQYDALAMPSEAAICGINRSALAVWSLDRGATTDGSLKLTCTSRYTLPALPAATRFVGLWALPGGSAKAALRLLACADSGRLLRLRPGGNPVDIDVPVGDTKVLAAAASSAYVAAACSNGKALLFSAASLEPAAVLELPGHLAHNASAVACCFAASSTQLVASYKGASGSLLATWDISTTQPALLSAMLRTCHSEGIADAVVIPASGNGSLVASCSPDGSVQMWRVSASGNITPSSSLDLRATLNSTTCKPLRVAASEDGHLLAVGDDAGCVHLFSVGDTGAPFKLSTTHACDTDTTALAFGPCPADGLAPLLAVGSKRGNVRLLQMGGSIVWHRSTGCSPAAGTSSAVLASVTDHKGAVIGLVFTNWQAGSGFRLTTCSVDGRQLTYSWDAEARQLQPTAQAAVPRASFAGLASVQGGQAVVAATKGGRISWAKEGGQEAVLHILDKRQGEVAAIDVDPSLSLLAVATNRNTLHLYRLSVLGGKPSASSVGSCKAHAAGTSITKVLILPNSGCVLTAGEDGSVCTHRLPAAIAAMLLSRCPAQAAAEQPQAAPASTAQPSAPSCSSVSGLSSVVQPRALINDLPSPAADAPPHAVPAAPVALGGSGPLTTVMAPPASLAAQQAPAEQAGQAPAALPAPGLRRAVSLPPSPNRAVMLAGMQDMEERFAELQSDVHRSFTVKRRPVQAPAAAWPPTAPPAARSPPHASSAAAAAGGSPSLKWFASPLGDTVSGISMGALSQSPDVFAALESPAVAAASPAVAPAGMQQQRSPAPPASVGSTSMGGSITAKLSRLMRRGWTRSPAAGSSSKSAGEQGAEAVCQSVAAALDAVDSGRTAALLRMSATEGPEASMAVSPPAAFMSANGTSSATVDLAINLGSQPRSASVNQPRRRRGWGPPPGSAEGLRRTFSAMEGTYPGSIASGTAAEEARRAHSVTGCEEQQQQQQNSPDAFSVYQDACSVDGTPPAEAAAAPSSSLSRRLSFSFGGGPRRTATHANGATTDQETPTMGAKPAPAQLAAASNPSAYAGRILPPVVPQQPVAAESTPRLFGFSMRQAPVAPAANEEPCPTPRAPAAVEAPAAYIKPAAAAAAPHASCPEPTAQVEAAALPPQPSAAAPTAAAAASAVVHHDGMPMSRGVLHGRPAVPKLNLSSVEAPMAEGAANAASSTPSAARGAAAIKRRRQLDTADPLEGLLESSSSSPGSMGSGSPQAGPGLDCTEAQQAQQAPEPEQGNSKKARPAMSPPRLVLNGLYEPGSAEAHLNLTSGYSYSQRCGSQGVFRPVASSGGTALSFERATAEEEEAEAATEESSQNAAEGPAADDPFSRPAAHDPLLEEETRPAAATRSAAAPIPKACMPASALSSSAAEVPINGCCSPEPTRAPASGRAASGASPFAAEPSLSAAMELLQSGALMLSCLGQPLSERTRADLADIATSLAGMAAPDAPAVTAPSAAAPAGCDRENIHSNNTRAGGGSQGCPTGFDAAAFKAEILRELRQELNLGQQ